MRNPLLAGLGLVAILAVAVLAAAWRSWLTWDFAVSVQLGDIWMEIGLGVLVLAVVLTWRWASSSSR
jgi:hypothetical protein